MKLKMENGSNGCDITRTRPRHGQKHTKYKACLRMIMVLCNKHYLRNIWSGIHEKVTQRGGWIKKSVACKKARNSAIAT